MHSLANAITNNAALHNTKEVYIHVPVHCSNDCRGERERKVGASYVEAIES